MPPERQWLSWIDTVDTLSPTNPHDEQTLADCLGVCFQNTAWDANPEQTHLYEFFARCWVYPALKIQIEQAMQYWSKA